MIGHPQEEYVVIFNVSSENVNEGAVHTPRQLLKGCQYTLT